jgi:hypothetical protein
MQTCSWSGEEEAVTEPATTAIADQLAATDTAPPVCPVG